MPGMARTPSGGLQIANGEREQQPAVLQPQERHVHLAVVAEVADAVEGLAPSLGREQDEVVGLIVPALIGRPLMGNSLLSTRTSAQILPDLACHSHVSPPKKPYWLWKSLRLALLRLVPGLPAVGRTPDEIRPASAVVVDAQQQRPIGQSSTFRVVWLCAFGLIPLGLDAHRLPRPAAVGRTMQEAAGVAPGVAHVLGQQVSGDEDGAVRSTVRYGSRPSRSSFSGGDQVLPPSLERKSSVCSMTLLPSRLVLMKGGQQQFAIGQPGDARLVVVRLADGDALAGDRIGGKTKRIPDRGGH